MSDYIYGDWYCKPSNEAEAEAKEIVERAIASGAANKDGWGGPEDGLPPVGTVCIGEHEDVNNGNPCTVEILKHNKNGIGCAVFWIDAPNGKRNLFWCSRFFPLRTAREKWVDAAARVPKPCGFALVPVLEQIYDAMQSGKLELPEVKS